MIIAELQNLQVRMDSDSDQDEDEVKPSLSATESKRGSQYSGLERMSLDSRKQSAGISNSSERVEEISELKPNFLVENSTSDSVGSVTLSTNEDPTFTTLAVSPSSQKKITLKSVIDDQLSSSEKAKDDVHNLIPEVNDNEGGGGKETSRILLDNLVQTLDITESGTNFKNFAESPIIIATISAPKDSHIKNEPGNSQDDNLLLKSSSVDPMENTVSIHLIGSTGLSEAVMPNENEQDASSTQQLAGRKRKRTWKKTADAEGAVGGSSAENSVSSGEAEESFENKDSDKDAKKKKNRCGVCRKKVGLTGFECRCGGLFCAVHRYSDKHDCTFDYREMGAQEIRRNNPVVVGEKIQKI